MAPDAARRVSRARSGSAPRRGPARVLRRAPALSRGAGAVRVRHRRAPHLGGGWRGRSEDGDCWRCWPAGWPGALVLILAYFVGVALVGAALGAVIVHMIWAQLAREPHPLMVIAGTVTGALCAMALQRYVDHPGHRLRRRVDGARRRCSRLPATARRRAPTAGCSIRCVRRPGQEWMWIGWLVLGGVGVVVQLAMRPRATARR